LEHTAAPQRKQREPKAHNPKAVADAIDRQLTATKAHTFRGHPSLSHRVWDAIAAEATAANVRPAAAMHAIREAVRHTSVTALPPLVVRPFAGIELLYLPMSAAPITDDIVRVLATAALGLATSPVPRSVPCTAATNSAAPERPARKTHTRPPTLTDLLSPSPERWEATRQLLWDRWYTHPNMAPWVDILVKPVLRGAGRYDLQPLFPVEHPLLEDLQAWIAECRDCQPTDDVPEPPAFPPEAHRQPPVRHPFSDDAIGQLPEDPVAALLSEQSHLRRVLGSGRFAAAYAGTGVQASLAAAPLAAPVHPERLAHWQRVLLQQPQQQVSMADLARGMGWGALRSDGPLLCELARVWIAETRARDGRDALPDTAWWTKGISPHTVRPRVCLAELRLAAITVGRVRAAGDPSILKTLLFEVRGL
jgi:hypothetical protein